MPPPQPVEYRISDHTTAVVSIAPESNPQASIDLPRLKSRMTLKNRLIPQESGDLKVYWARMTLISIIVAATICAVLEIWVIINQVKLRDFLLELTSDPEVLDTIWFNFQIAITFNAVFVASIWFWLFITWDSIIHLNTVEVVAINFYNLGLFVFGVSQILQIEKDHGEIKIPLSESQNDYFTSPGFRAAQILIPIVIGIYSCLFGFLLGPKLLNDFSWRQYRITGGSMEVKSLFFNYDVHLLLLKFSLFFLTGFTVINLVLTTVTPNGAILIPVFGTILGFFIAVSGFYGARYEIRWLAMTYEAGLVGAMGYISQRVYTAYSRDGETSSRVEIPFLVYAACSGLLLIASFGFGVRVIANFGKGLKEVLDQEMKRKNGEFVPQEIDLDA
ncbi:hypothetical protein HDU98_011090 [Podochytrium sp. JEL0797]|nr:hypothetical protein HDU98_011090 [Podochytrium sp. JEL0797]